MRNSIWIVVTLCLAACAAGCRGNSAAVNLPASGGSNPAGGQANTVRLTLDAKQEAGDYRLILSAPNASDLYQLAGTLVYDPQRYTLQRVEAGGGLGGPEASYLFDGEHTAGRHAFAYTKRYAGPGANGAVSLLHFIVVPLQGKFKLDDFKLDTTAGQLKVRDSKKHDFSVSVTRGTVQP